MGENENTLEEAVADILAQNDATVTLIEVRTKGEILAKLKAHTPERVHGEFIDGKDFRRNAQSADGRRSEISSTARWRLASCSALKATNRTLH